MLTDRRVNKEEIKSVFKQFPNDPRLGSRGYVQITNSSISTYLNPQLQNTEKLRDVVKNMQGLTLISPGISRCPKDEKVVCAYYDYSDVPNKFEIFLSAYSDLQNKEYGSALDKFIKYDLFYLNAEPIYGEEPTLRSEILPYIAIAGAKMGKTDNVNEYLENEVASRSKKFDYWLAKAIINSVKGDIDDSIESLKKAFIAIPFPENRSIFPWYQLAETSEWLFDETGDQRFIEIALNWMQDYQVIQPIYAWSYAFEAKYSKDKLRRVRAIGIADYLDMNSHWLSGVPNGLKLKARKWMKDNNPFSLEKQPEIKESI